MALSGRALSPRLCLAWPRRRGGAAELHRCRPRRVASGVSAATSAYLFTHPDVNDFFTGLEGTPGTSCGARFSSILTLTHRSGPNCRASVSRWWIFGPAAGAISLLRFPPP